LFELWFAVVDILQPCVTFNKINTYPWFQEKVYKIEEIPTDKMEALKLAQEWDKKIRRFVLADEDEDQRGQDADEEGGEAVLEALLGEVHDRDQAQARRHVGGHAHLHVEGAPRHQEVGNAV